MYHRGSRVEGVEKVLFCHVNGAYGRWIRCLQEDHHDCGGDDHYYLHEKWQQLDECGDHLQSSWKNTI